MLIFAVLGCSGTTDITAGAFEIALDKRAGTFDVTHASAPFALNDARILAGAVDASVEMRFGAFKFDAIDKDVFPSGRFGDVKRRFEPIGITVADADGDDLGTLLVSPLSGTEDVLLLEFSPSVSGTDLVGLSAACDSDEQVLGL